MPTHKLVLLLGAGATVSDVASRPEKTRPPLDKKFFAIGARAQQQGTIGPLRTVRRYMRTAYGQDILDPQLDSLEAVMGQIYTDIFNPVLEAEARSAFQALVRLFTLRLAHTTNNMPATNKRLLYRILTAYLSEGLEPNDITIVTFNQDLQAEKVLMLVRETARWVRVGARVFRFPGCYMLQPDEVSVSPPNLPIFPVDEDSDDDCLRLLKLHGSLNWFSTHTSRNPPPTAMFRPDRTLRITRRRTIEPMMTYAGGSRTTYAVPIVVPPVTHKSAVLHNRMRVIWGYAEQRLKEADEIIVFGYSCPPLDFESLNLLRRSRFAGSNEWRKVSIIDPDAGVLPRYAELLCPHGLHYYPDAHDFLAAL